MSTLFSLDYMKVICNLLGFQYDNEVMQSAMAALYIDCTVINMA